MRLRWTAMAATVLAGLLAATVSAVRAQDMTAPTPLGPDAAFEAFVQSIRPRAIAAGVRPQTFDSVAATLSYNPRVVSLDRAQPGGSPSSPSAPIAGFAPYQREHVSAAMIAKGRSRYGALRPLLARAEARTGVPEGIMLSIYGHETSYGAGTGNFDLLRSLATLAFDGRRRELFTGEFIDALRILDQGVPRARLYGSWAGAMGYPQFLPSVYLRLAVDADGDGRRDIWTSEPDALASIGNYLANAGWKPGVPWGVAVRVPPTLDRGMIATRLVSPRCPRVLQRHSRWLTIGEWRALGIQFTGWTIPGETEQASLIEPDGPDATAYLLTTNYRVILDYNCSNFYALSVGLLADAVSR